MYAEYNTSKAEYRIQYMDWCCILICLYYTLHTFFIYLFKIKRHDICTTYNLHSTGQVVASSFTMVNQSRTDKNGMVSI